MLFDVKYKIFFSLFLSCLSQLVTFELIRSVYTRVVSWLGKVAFRAVAVLQIELHVVLALKLHPESGFNY